MTHSKPNDREGHTGWLSGLSLWTGRLLVVALLAYAPWYYGMVTWTQQLLLLPLATGILLCAWFHAISQNELRVRFPPLLVSLLILVALATFQVIPMPKGIFDAISAGAAFERSAVAQAAEYLSIEPTDPDLLAASRDTGPLFQTLSIHPWQTRASLVGLTSATIILLGCGLLFRNNVGRILLLITLSLVSTSVAIVGIMQNISWNQWTLLEMPYQTGFATFVSRNSAPQYLAIGIGSTFALAVTWLAHKRRKARHDKRYRGTTAFSRLRFSLEDTFRELDASIIMIVVSLLLQIGAVVGAASRGGVVALLIALVITLLLTLSRNQKMMVPGILAISLLGLLFVFFLSSFELDEEIARRLDTHGLDSQIRVEFWKTALSQSEYWLTGSGLGNFHFAIMPGSKEHAIWIYHAESIFVELLSDFGFLGGLAGLVGLGWLIAQLFKRPEPRSTIVWPAVLYATCAITLQSTVDFSLIIPAIFVSMAALVGAYLPETDVANRVYRVKDRSKNRKREVSTYGRTIMASQRAVQTPAGERPDSAGQLQAVASPNRSKPTQHAGTRSRKVVLTVITIGLLAVLWQGAVPLNGFAQAEKIESLFWINQDESQVLGLPYDLTHPEVVIQLARRKVEATEEYLRESSIWPADMTVEQREQFTRLEFVTSNLRSPTNDHWPTLKKQWAGDEAIEMAIGTAHLGFDYMARFCPMDWRGHWGVFQTTYTKDPIRHALTCARLKQLTVSLPRMQQAVGTCSLLANDHDIGIDFWRNSLTYHPEQTNRLAALVGMWLDKDDVETIIPNAQIPRAALSRALLSRENSLALGQEILASVDLPKLQAEAETDSDWDLVAWASQSTGNQEALIDALRKLAIFRPMDKSVRVKLAQALESMGAIDEAIQHMEQASRRTTLTPSDDALLRRLREAKLPPPTE